MNYINLMSSIVRILLCLIQEKYINGGSQHNKLLKLKRTRYYSISIRLLAQMLMLHF
jgi:hypothetical protein